MSNLNILADQYAQIKAAADKANKELEAIKDKIKALGEKEIVGLHFTVTVSDFNRSDISAKLVKELLSPEDVALVTETKNITMIRVKASLANAA